MTMTATTAITITAMIPPLRLGFVSPEPDSSPDDSGSISDVVSCDDSGSISDVVSCDDSDSGSISVSDVVSSGRPLMKISPDVTLPDNSTSNVQPSNVMFALYEDSAANNGFPVLYSKTEVEIMVNDRVWIKPVSVFSLCLLPRTLMFSM